MVRLLASATVLLLVLTHCGAWAVDVALVPRFPSFGSEAALKNLERRVADGEQARMRGLFPEGGLFTLSFTGFALVNEAVQRPDDDGFRASARTELVRLLRASEAERRVPPFSSWRERDRLGARPWRGVILEGHQNLLRAGYAILDGKDERILDDYHRTSAALFAMFMRAPSGAIESFGGRTWFVDNAVALESLRLHDVLYGSHYSAALVRFRAGLRAHLDERAGLPASEVSLDGTRTRDGARGCALSWLFAFTPSFGGSEDAAAWSHYVSAFGVDVAGMRGFREYPPWRAGHIDVDSGPIVDGIGAAASAFGIAAARAHDDGDTLGRMLTALEILTVPSLTLHGDTELFAGRLVLADAIALWGRTITPWDAPRPAPPTSPPLLATLIAEIVLLFPVWLALRWFRRSLARFVAQRAASERDDERDADQGASESVSKIF